MSRDSKFRIIIQNIMQGTGINQTISLLDKGINRAKAFGEAMRKGFHSAPVRLLRNALAGLIGTMAAGVMQAAKFNIEMARAWTMTSEGVGWFREMRKEIIAMSAELGVATDQLSSGLYQELSRGVPKENLIDFLRTAAKVAVADGSTVEEIVLGMTNMLNGFGIEMSRSMEIADQMFNVVANGGLSFRELAAHISDVSGVAASAGIPFEQILAHIAAMTKQGDPASKATTSIRASIVGLNKALGDGWAKQMTYQEALQKVWEKSGKSQTQLLKLVGSIEAVNAVLKGVDGNAAVAAQALEETANSAGRVDAAFQKVDMWRHWPKLWQSINGLVKTAGLELDERLAPAVDRIAEMLNGIRENDDLWAGLGDSLDQAQQRLANIFEYIRSEGSSGAREVVESLGQILLGYAKNGAQDAIAALAYYMPLLGRTLGESAKKALTEHFEMNAIAKQLATEELGPVPKGREAQKEYGDRYSALVAEKLRRMNEIKAAEEGKRLAAIVGKPAGDGAGDADIATGKAKLDAIATRGFQRKETDRFMEEFIAQQSAPPTPESEDARLQKEASLEAARAEAQRQAAKAQAEAEQRRAEAQRQKAEETKRADDALAAAEKQSRTVKARFGTPDEKAAAKSALEAAQAKAASVREPFATATPSASTPPAASSTPSAQDEQNSGEMAKMATAAEGVKGKMNEGAGQVTQQLFALQQSTQNYHQAISQALQQYDQQLKNHASQINTLANQIRNSRS